jgi:hypothetical protein
MSSQETSRLGSQDLTGLRSFVNKIMTALQKSEDLDQLENDIESNRRTCRLLVDKKEEKIKEGKQTVATLSQSYTNKLLTPNELASDPASNPYGGILRLLASNFKEYKEAGEKLLEEFRKQEAKRAARSREMSPSASSPLVTKK